MTKFSCRISNIGQTGEYDPANPGYNTALLDIYHIRCQRWQDPNQHAITKYIFKGKFSRWQVKSHERAAFPAVEEVQDGFKSRLLYAGPLDNAKVIFGVGRFKLNAEVVKTNKFERSSWKISSYRFGTKQELSPPLRSTPPSPR